MYIEMVSALLRRKLSSFLDEIPELRLSSLEFSSFIIAAYPVGDLVVRLLAPLV